MAKATRVTNAQLEDKFARTAFRLSQERNDFFLPQVLDFVRKKKWLNLRPEYQRRLVWDSKKRSLFIESLLLNVPIPSIFLYEWELGRYEVMDGQQRLSAVIDFYENEYPLRGLEKWRELNGRYYRDLPETLQRGLDRRRLSATVMLLEHSAEDPPERGAVRKLVFERLNTGGQHLNAQEIRNCLYSGLFNELLIELSRLPLFTKIWEIPPYAENSDAAGNVTPALAENRYYKRMIDTEVVLRFFAFRSRQNIRGAVRTMLDRVMIANQQLDDAAVQGLRKEYEDRLKLAHAIFGAQTFRHLDRDGAWKLSQPLYDAVMVALDRLWAHRTKLRNERSRIRSSLERAMRDDEVYAVLVGRPNTAKAVLRRIDIVTKTMMRAARL